MCIPIAPQIDYSTERSYTYKQLKSYVRKFAASLYKKGVRKGDRVCVYLPGCMEFPVVWLGAMYTGAATLPINPMLTEGQLLFFHYASFQ